jgi:hypothetical protein
MVADRASAAIARVKQGALMSTFRHTIIGPSLRFIRHKQTWLALGLLLALIFGSGRIVRAGTTHTATTYTVTSTADSGAGTLRQAITDANANSGTDTINFNITGSGVQTITPSSSLPTINDPVIIDGTTQPGWAAGAPVIELVGSTAGGVGLNITAGSTTVKGLIIRNFGSNGITLATNGSNTIQGNFIGVDSTGTIDQGNGNSGISVASGTNNLIGGTTAAQRNVIAGNNANGVVLQSDNNTIQGNYIGVNLAGNSAIANNNTGILVSGSSNLIGGTTSGAGNLVSGNSTYGVQLNGNNNTIQGNYIGTNSAGTGAIPNGFSQRAGLKIGGAANIVGGTAAGAGNLISGNAPASGIMLSGSTNTIQGNTIGANAAGTGALPNAYGISLSSSAGSNTIGGSTAAERNVISGNSSHGIYIGVDAGTGNTILGNYLGLDKNGSTAVANVGSGISFAEEVFGVFSSGTIVGGTATGAGNVISGNTGTAIELRGSAQTVQGNIIGLNAAGTAAIANGADGIFLEKLSNSTIGGTVSGAGNVISGNTDDGITVASATNSNTIQGNLIGLNAAGTAAIPNSSDGIQVDGGDSTTIGGTATGAGNVISGNTANGINITGGATPTIQGNYIGLNKAGTAAVANGTNGISISVSSITIGGTATGAGNVISGNSGDGINVSSGTGNTIVGNIIGLDTAGTAKVANSSDGIEVAGGSATIGGATAGERNIISGNSGNGVNLASGASATTIQGNYIGTNVTGNSALGNSMSGISIYNSANTIGGAVSGAGNVLSGNTFYGVYIHTFSTGANTIKGNTIGANALGTAALANGQFGIFSGGSSNIIGGTTAAATNLVSGNTIGGIVIFGSGTTVQGNKIGTDITGAAAIPNLGAGITSNGSAVTIGGTTSGAGNLISGNTGDGIAIPGGLGSTTVLGNIIGANAAQTAALANGGDGIEVGIGAPAAMLGGTTSGAGNLISGNSGNGIVLGNSGNTVQGNTIGGAIGNSLAGLLISTTGNTIGGTGAGEANTISGNGKGVAIIGNIMISSSLLLSGTTFTNMIYGNTGPGIDLNNDGPTANDSHDVDTGPNQLQNSPILTSVTIGATLTVKGTLNSANSTAYTLYLFANTVCNPATYGEAQSYLGTTSVTTNSNGNYTFTVASLPVISGQYYISALAVDPSGNTSEFSKCMTVTTASTVVTQPAPSVTTSNPLYKWNAISGVTSYLVQVSGSSGVVMQQWYATTTTLCPTTTCSVTSPVKLWNGSYTINVRTYSPLGGYGAWSPNKVFTVAEPAPAIPVLTSPSGTTIPSDHPTFRWGRPARATSYALIVRNTSGIVLQYSLQASCTTVSCWVTPSEGLLNGNYTWQVQSYGPGGYSAWSAESSFAVSVKPVLISPTSGVTTSRPTFTWNPIVQGTAYTLSILLASNNQIFYQQDLQASAICTASLCSYTIPYDLGNVSYKWRVRGYSGTGWSVYSTPITFTVDVPAPQTEAILISPVGSSASNPPTYSWYAVHNATWYYVLVENAAGNTVLGQWYDASVCSGTVCSITPPTVLPAGTYTWWVQTQGPGGYGPWSDPKTFTVGGGSGAPANPTPVPTFVPR